MSDTLESLQRKKQSAAELQSVVSTMKAIAAANITQYEQAVTSLKDYYRTVSLGINAWFFGRENTQANNTTLKGKEEKLTYAVVFGSDQGLVGRFNEILVDFVQQTLAKLPGKKEVWAVGERMYDRLADAGLTTTTLFPVPNSVTAITPLVGQVLIKSEEKQEAEDMDSLYIFHNSPLPGDGYGPVQQKLLPLGGGWKENLAYNKWPTNNLPQVAGNNKITLSALIREYLFVTLFRACAESLASENASRLEAMQRAEKNIDEMLGSIKQTYQRMRQNTIDEELFDLIAGFEALKTGHNQ